MAVPIIPILKKVAVAIVSDKKGRKVVIGIVLGIIFVIMMPIIAILGIFSGGIDLGLDDINSLVQQQQTVGESTLTAIEESMLDEGYSQLKVEEAQAIYLLALFDKTDEENFVDRLVGCFATEQTDTELISAVNAEFGTAINPSDFTVAVQEIRDKYAEQEDDESG